MDGINELLIASVEALEEDNVLRYVNQALDEGTSPKEITACIQKGIDNVGRKFEEGQYFVADLMMAGIIFKEILEIDAFKPTDDDFTNYRYKILLGTVFGDLHDIGKDIFGSMAKASGFQVIDLGIDVQPSSFANEITRIRPDILALSGVLSGSVENMATTIRYLKEANLREGLKIIVGGTAVNEDANELIDSDSFTNDASLGVEICKKWAREFDERRSE